LMQCLAEQTQVPLAIKADMLKSTKTISIPDMTLIQIDQATFEISEHAIYSMP